MKKTIEGIKDFLYDSIDYIFIIGIVGAVVLVISWRLDILFASDQLDMPKENPIVVEDTDKTDKLDIPSVNLEDEIDDEEYQEEDEDHENDIDLVDKGDDDNIEEPTIVYISIPSGSLPSKIGSILEEKGLISSKGDFVMKAQEMKLDTKLKSGDFEILSGSTIEEIIKIIAK